jgi:hypothetical protein
MSNVGLLIDTSKAWDDKDNFPVPWRRGERSGRFSNVMDFCCPASLDGSPELPTGVNYVGITGLGETAAELPLSGPRAGFFGHDRQIRLTDIKDGTANTMAVAEVLDGGPWTAGGHPTVRGLVADGRPYLGEGGQFASLHAETNVLFANASVRSFTATLSPEVFEAMATIAGGEPVGPLTD